MAIEIANGNVFLSANGSGSLTITLQFSNPVTEGNRLVCRAVSIPGSPSCSDGTDAWEEHVTQGDASDGVYVVGIFSHIVTAIQDGTMPTVTITTDYGGDPADVNLVISLIELSGADAVTALDGVAVSATGTGGGPAVTDIGEITTTVDGDYFVGVFYSDNGVGALDVSNSTLIYEGQELLISAGTGRAFFGAIDQFTFEPFSPNLLLDNAGQAYHGAAVAFMAGTAAPPVAPADSLNFPYEWDAVAGNPFMYAWKSKVFITPGRENFAFVQIKARFEQGMTEAQLAAIAAQTAVIQASNAALITSTLAAGGTFGALNHAAINQCNEINGDCSLQDVPQSNFGSCILFRYWAGGVLKMERTICSEEPVPMPGGFMAEKHEVAVYGKVQIDEITLATSVEELAST